MKESVEMFLTIAWGTYQTRLALRGQFTFHSHLQQVGEMGIKDKKREDGISRRKPGVEERSLSVGKTWLKLKFINSSFSSLGTRGRSVFNQTHLHDLNFLLFSLMDLCECRRTIEKVLRDKNRASGRIRNRIRRRLYLTENCEIAKYKKTFPIRRFLSQRYTSAPPVHLCQHAPVYLGDSSSQWRNASVCL